MTYKLWIDDQIDDPNTPLRHVPKGFIGAKSSDHAKNLTQLLGPPKFIDFDHDLGENDDATIFIDWLIENYFDAEIDYAIHSANPEGIKRIQSRMNSWKKARGL